MLTKSQYENLVGEQNNIVVEIDYSPDGFHSSKQKYIVSIWELGIWEGEKFLVIAIIKAFYRMRWTRKKLKAYEGENLDHPWSHYREYLQKRDKNSSIKYGWSNNRRPQWYRIFEMFRGFFK